MIVMRAMQGAANSAQRRYRAHGRRGAGEEPLWSPCGFDAGCGVSPLDVVGYRGAKVLCRLTLRGTEWTWTGLS